MGLLLVAMAIAVPSTVVVMTNQLSDNMPRIPGVFKGIPASARPQVPAADRESMTILLVGSDSRSARQPLAAEQGEQPSADAAVLVHLSASGRAVSVISIPRNSWVRAPGFGMTVFYNVLSLGGPPLMIRTVELLTGIRIDHYAVIDLAGLGSLVRVLGGVQVAVARSTRREGIAFHKGVNELTPRSAMVYASTATRLDGCPCWQRNGRPGGDLSRVQRQQNLLRAIIAKAASWHPLTSPIALYRLIDALSHIVSVDSTFTNSEFRSLALRLAALHDGDFTFLTAPVRALGWRDHLRAVFLNRAQCATLWDAVSHDGVASWAARHPALLTPAVPY